jgi:hypothetical protein
VADPLRACIVQPEPDGGRRANVAALLREERRQLRVSIERLERFRALEAPECLIEAEEQLGEYRKRRIAYVESRLPAILPDPDDPELIDEDGEKRCMALNVEIMRRAVRPYTVLLPRRAGRILGLFAYLVVLRHPRLFPLAYEAAMGPGREPGRDRGYETLGMLIHHLGDLLQELRVPGGRRKIAARAREIAHAGREPVAKRDDTLPLSAGVWSEIVVAVFLDALGPAHGAAAEPALRRAVELAAAADRDPELASRPARDRLGKIAQVMSKALTRDYLRAVQGAPVG